MLQTYVVRNSARKKQFQKKRIQTEKKSLASGDQTTHDIEDMSTNEDKQNWASNIQQFGESFTEHQDILWRNTEMNLVNISQDELQYSHRQQLPLQW